MRRLILILLLLLPLHLFSQSIDQEVRTATNMGDLIVNWGQPAERTYQGELVKCTWYYSGGRFRPTFRRGDRWCTVTVLFNEAREKVNWTWDGNDCR